MPQPVTEKVTMTAGIKAIDKIARLVMLKGEKGNVVAVQVGEQVKRFNELVGDKVSATCGIGGRQRASARSARTNVRLAARHAGHARRDRRRADTITSPSSALNRRASR